MGHEGFENHLKTVQAKYTRRAEIITQAAEKHLQDLAEWAPISAGMFMWIRLKGIDDANIVLSDLQSAGVIVVPGMSNPLQNWSLRHIHRCLLLYTDSNSEKKT